MRAAFYSKSPAAKTSFFERFLANSGPNVAIFVYPKNRKKEITIPSCPGCNVFPVTYEDLTKTREWLHVNSLVGPSTALLLDNPSRYAKITSPKVAALQRLEKGLQIKAISDIVPFTMDVQYLYTPLSLLGRDILGYPHYYAFRENYHERDESGRVRNSHDFDVLAPKVATVGSIDYRQFLVTQPRQIIEHECTVAELAQYTAARDKLFESEEFSPQVAITKLADLSHAFDSRIEALLDVLSLTQGRTVVYCNLSSYAKKAQSAAKKAGHKNVLATSYQVGASGDFDNCIYLESPIVKGYFLLDAESRLPQHCQVYHIVGSAKVDRYLFGLSQHETTQINEFTKELSRVSGSKARPENLSTEKCSGNGTRANQLDIFNLQECLC